MLYVVNILGMFFRCRSILYRCVIVIMIVGRCSKACNTYMVGREKEARAFAANLKKEAKAAKAKVSK